MFTKSVGRGRLGFDILSIMAEPIGCPLIFERELLGLRARARDVDARRVWTSWLHLYDVRRVYMT